MQDNNEGGATSECGWRIVHIPSKPPVLPHLQPTVNVFAAEIDPKDASILVRKLNKICPMEDMRHVKRIRKKCNGGKPQLSILLSVSNEDAGDIPCNVQELVKEYQLNTFIEKVCKYAASTKEEWEEQCKLWPTSFHPPTYNISGITGFNEVESQQVFSFMQLAINLAKPIDGSPVSNAAVIVDPCSNQVISSGCDEVIMNTPRKGLCFSGKELIESGVTDNVSCLHPWKWAEDDEQVSSSWHPLRHAPMVAIECSSARDRQLFPNSGNGFVQEDHFQLSPCKKQKLNSDCQTEHHYESNRPYLCTGYDIYLVWEPCLMCAMALVHQRVRRVFYALPNPEGGALGSVYRLQGESSLNHHYAVFKVLLPEGVFKYEEVSH